MLYLSLFALVYSNVNSSHPLVTDVVWNFSRLLPGFPISSNFILTSVSACADQTLIVIAFVVEKSNLESKSIWVLSQFWAPNFVTFPTLQDVFTALSKSGLSIISKVAPSSKAVKADPIVKSNAATPAADCAASVVHGSVAEGVYEPKFAHSESESVTTHSESETSVPDEFAQSTFGPEIEFFLVKVWSFVAFVTPATSQPLPGSTVGTPTISIKLKSPLLSFLNNPIASSPL